MTAALYHAAIVAHDRAPHREGALPGATHTATLDNPLCGDTVTIAFAIDGAAITDARFTARGCALCRAAASMLCDRAAGATIAELRALGDAFEAFVGGAEPATALGELVAFEGVRGVKSRRPCATLPVRAARIALG